MSSLPRTCCVMASDAPFFYQIRASVETFDAVRKSVGADMKVIALGLDQSQMDWLCSRGIEIVTGVESRVPRFRDSPLHAIAMTCRPFIPELFPGYEAYMWIDSDIRFLHPDGFNQYMESLIQPRCSIAIASESEPAYCFNHVPAFANAYHEQKYARLCAAFGEEVANYLRYTLPFNAGIFAAPADSPLWSRYKRNLDRTLALPYNAMREQDAMLVSIVEVQDVVRMPSVANWVCSARMPAVDDRIGGRVFLNPDKPTEKILVAHLAASSKPVFLDGKMQTLYNTYQLHGLTT